MKFNGSVKEFTERWKSLQLALDQSMQDKRKKGNKVDSNNFDSESEEIRSKQSKKYRDAPQKPAQNDTENDTENEPEK